MDYLLNDDKSDNNLARKIFIFSNQEFSCYHSASLGNSSKKRVLCFSLLTLS